MFNRDKAEKEIQKYFYDVFSITTRVQT